MYRRTITYKGKNSFADFGVLINSERTNTPPPGQRSASETIPYRDGKISVVTGLEPQELTYCFVVTGGGRREVTERIRTLTDWLSGAASELADSDTEGVVYTGAYRTGEGSTEWVSQNFTAAYFTVTLNADPEPVRPGSDNTRIISMAGEGDASVTVTNNRTVTAEIGGVSKSAVFSVAEPYTYRLICHTEGIPTATLNGSALDVSNVFTMPDEAVITISNSGYGYYELRHDTRRTV